MFDLLKCFISFIYINFSSKLRRSGYFIYENLYKLKKATATRIFFFLSFSVMRKR